MSSAALPDDVARFVAFASRGHFRRGDPVFIARAPGRLDLMGGIADYSGSLVLELRLAAATFVAAQLSRDRTVLVHTQGSSAIGHSSSSEFSLDSIDECIAAPDYAKGHSTFAHDRRSRWAAYVVGTFLVLGREKGFRFHEGLRMVIDSAVPAGKGVASSAALEVAAMQAVCAAYEIEIDGHELAILCQKVENLVVGAPCGIMDQMTSACGEENRLLALLCQPAEIVSQVALPDGLEIWGIDSGVRHEVGGADYGGVRVGAFMGYRIVAELAGLPATDRGDAHVDVDDPRWRGYLANLSPGEWSREFRDRVPIEMDGRVFLERYHGITDRVTRVDPNRVYAVRQPTEHPILENDRVARYQRLLESGARAESERAALGELMYESHESYGACGLGSSGTDALVELVRTTGRDHGLYGAKITGGGSGGVVAVLAREGSKPIVDEVAARYSRETGRAASVLGGSSAGAAAFGTIRVDLASSSS
jgi:L-arabinokinase